MQQVTLNIPNEKMPAFRQFLRVLRNDQNKSETNMNNNFLKQPETPAKFHPYYDWEFFMSELEYE